MSERDYKLAYEEFKRGYEDLAKRHADLEADSCELRNWIAEVLGLMEIFGWLNTTWGKDLAERVVGEQGVALPERKNQ